MSRATASWTLSPGLSTRTNAASVAASPIANFDTVGPVDPPVVEMINSSPPASTLVITATRKLGIPCQIAVVLGHDSG
jgi:hypothetical protein